MVLKLFKNTYFLWVIIAFLSLFSCAEKLPLESKKNTFKKDTLTKFIETGAQQINKFEHLLAGKKIGVVANQTSIVFKNKKNNSSIIHLIDTLLSKNVVIVSVFSPEHGFRGTADASEYVADGIDIKTNLPIVSLYGNNRKPTKKQLEGIDLMLFDLQDVGVRFYTYISTLHYIMEACAENNIALIVLDRPNPNAHYIDGPTLEIEHKSFVGMHPVPLVYGMTIGEYAKMINGEKWLKNGIQCDLTIIPLKNYTHQTNYSLPVRPSPNLPNDLAINLYPSLGFFEGTPINAGRGTSNQFQQYGAPFFPESDFSYIPQPNFGAKNPKFNGEVCYGVSLKKELYLNYVNINYLLDAYKKTPSTISFFGPTFTIHAGTKNLEFQLKNNWSAEAIRASWQPQIEAFLKVRKKYLLYK